MRRTFEGYKDFVSDLRNSDLSKLWYAIITFQTADNILPPLTYPVNLRPGKMYSIAVSTIQQLTQASSTELQLEG